jgi:tetratricopeptide (TPR) repeat protein
MPVSLKPLMKLKLPKVLIFSFCALLLLLYGCSTTNHALLPAQANADITSHYNAWFNTNDKIQSILAISLETHKDKFDSVIPVYYYSSPKEFAAHASDLDDIIKRSTVAIQIHPISNWTDDQFMVIGKANYLKGEYDKAANSFKYITTQFKNGVDYVKVMKSLKKKVGKYVPGKPNNIKPQVKTTVNPDGTKTLEKIDNRPEETLWIHTPARSDALVWLIKTYTRQGKYDQASAIVTYVRSDNNFYRNYDDDLNLAEADVRVAKKDYAGAITPLEKYLESDKVRKKKNLTVRPLFVLAQCYQMLGNNSKAIENYKLVLKSHPNYDMEFYAKIKMAKLARGSANDNAAVRALLAKMAKQQRYREYWDQVYYELALISLSENNKPEARGFLHNSIKFSKSNEQKGIAFLKLADLDYEDEAYVPAKFFYDSTLSFMAKNDKLFRPTEERDKVLDNLVKQLNIIAEEDSLQKLAAMSKEDIEAAIKAAIARKQKDDEDKKAAAELAKQQALLNANNPNSPNGQNTAGGSSWYFYSTATRAQGYNDFTKKWGNRNLEEDWRRANKNTSTSAEDDALLATDTATAKKDSIVAPKGTLEEKMYANIPTTPEKMAKSIDRMVDAYYNAGTIYKDGLESYVKAQDMFETVNARVPKHKLLLESYYNLYLIALKLKKPDMAEKYKNLILQQFPESVIAKVLKDPNYVNQAKLKEKAIDDYFESAYNDYSQNRLDSAWYKAEMSNSIFKPNTLAGKFQLLQALILSKQNRLGDYVQALNGIINKSSDAQIKKSASDLLQLLNKSKLPQVDLSKDTSRRDSLNAVYGAMQMPVVMNAARPDTAELTMLQKMEQAKERAIKSGLLKPDTAAGKPVASANAKDTTSKGAAVTANSKTPDVVTEDTTSIYKRSDDAVHLFIIYIKDPATPKGAIMSTLAKINAYNSTQYADKRLQAKQSLLDTKNQLIAVRQFKSKDDVMAYYNSIITQTQLFNDMKPAQYSLTAISMPNYSTLISEKDVDTYNKFFNRVYKKKVK